MCRWPALVIVFAAISVIAGCADSGPPEVPPTPVGNPNSICDENFSAGRAAWGYWDCVIDVESQTVEVLPLRTAEFTANVNKLLAGSSGGLSIDDLDLTDFFTQGILGFNVSVKHPLAGLDRFPGFDVWGVFLHNGASTLHYDNLTYPSGANAGPDEAVLLNADGYTRWFNQPEFDGDGPPLFEYWPGSPSSLPSPTSKLNGFKIFADGLDKDVDYHTWITSPGYSQSRNFFRSGAVNSRTYEIQFPMPTGSPHVSFQFCVIATWAEGDPAASGNPSFYEPADFPPDANVDEAFYVNVSTADSGLYFETTPVGTDVGGNFSADIEIFDWQGGIAGHLGILNEIERVIIEGSFLPGGSQYILDHPGIELLAISSSVNSSIVQVDIPDCTPVGSGLTDVWVIVESAGEFGSSYDQGYPSAFPEDVQRAAFQRGTVDVSDEAPFVNTPPEINLIEDDIVGPGMYLDPVSTDYKEVTYNVVYFDPDTGQDHTITWWIVPDGHENDPMYLVTMPVDWSTYAPDAYDIIVEVDDGYDAVIGGPFDITLVEGTIPEWGDPIQLDNQSEMPRAVVNHAGEIVLIYHKQDSGIMYAVNSGDWSAPETAYYWEDGPKSVIPTYLQVFNGESDHTVYASYRGWGEDESCLDQTGRHALRWNGGSGMWDYTWLWGYTERETLLIPDGDGTWLNVYTHQDIDDPGPELRGSDRDYWGQELHDPGLLPWYDGYFVELSDCPSFVSDNTNHYIAYRKLAGSVDAAMVARVSKSSVNDFMAFTIQEASSGEELDSVALCMDSTGKLHAAWRVKKDNVYRIEYAYSVNQGATWSDAVIAYNAVEEYYRIQKNHIGIVTDSDNHIYITFGREPYLYKIESTDGFSWTEPDSPYEGPLPLGWHWTQSYPVITNDDGLSIFFITKNEQWQFGNINVVTWE